MNLKLYLGRPRERAPERNVKRHKLLCIKEISYEDVLYSTAREPIFYNNHVAVQSLSCV